MKHHALLVAILAVNLTGLYADSPIPADSKQLLDFRGSPNFSATEFQRLYRCESYEELRDQLLRAIEAISPKPGAELEDLAQQNALATCKLALIRTYYILGELEEADKRLLELHPVNQGQQIKQ